MRCITESSSTRGLVGEIEQPGVFDRHSGLTGERGKQSSVFVGEGCAAAFVDNFDDADTLFFHAQGNGHHGPGHEAGCLIGFLEPARIVSRVVDDDGLACLDGGADDAFPGRDADADNVAGYRPHGHFQYRVVRFFVDQKQAARLTVQNVHCAFEDALEEGFQIEGGSDGLG
jgi:hypothetical protein